MSISAEIKERIGLLINEGRLFHLSPWLGGEERIRTMFVSQEVAGDIQPPFGDSFDGIRHAEFREVLDSFILGWPLTVAEDPHNKPSFAMLARVHPVTDEIWDLRCIEPDPGIRCFGLFAGKDTFIALTWDYRENLCGEIGWRKEIECCKAKWNELFGTLAPFKGRSIDEYLSEPYRAV